MYESTAEESAAYCLDKCKAEAGNCREDELPPDARPPRSAWTIVWDLFTAIAADMKKAQR